MNKIYRIVFNAVTGRWVVASELATGRKKQGGRERMAVAAVLVTGALGSLMGAAHAGVVVNGDPQEATASCELITDSGTTTWTASTNAGACLAPVLAGSASGQGNPGADAVFYASNKTNGSEDSLNLGGYLDTWKTATFHGGIAMDGQKITGLANGTAATDAATYGQLNDATRYMKVRSAGADATFSVSTTDAIAIGGGSVAGAPGFSIGSGQIAIGPQAHAAASNSIAFGTNAGTATDGYYVANTTDLIAVGTNAEANYGHSVAIGGNAKALPPANGSNGFGYAVALGDSASVTSAHGSALGALSSATAADAVALGYQSVADRANTVSVGSSSAQRQIINVADGTAATDAATVGQLNKTSRYVKVGGGANDGTDDASASNGDVAIGRHAAATYNNTVAIGDNAKADYNDNMAIGSGAYGGGGASMAIGTRASTLSQAAVNYQTAVGVEAKTEATFATALGGRADAKAAGSIALSADAVADRASGAGGSTKGALSVGSGGAGVATDTRQIISVARGTQDTDAVNVAQLKGVTTAIGGGAAVNADGTIKAPSYALSNANTIGGTSGAAADVGAGFAKVDSALGKVNTAVAQNTTDIAGNTSSITSLQTTVNNITNGTTGLVQQSAAGANLTVGKGTDGAAVDFADKNGTARKLLKVAAGTVASGSTDAVNGGQLYTTNQNVAQNTADISSLGGRVTTAEGNISTINTNVTNLGGRVTTAESNITNLQNTVNNISSGSAGLVQQSAAGANLTVGKGTDGAAVDFADKNGTARKLLKVAAGAVASGSTDAVNGGQLYTTNQAVAQNTAAISTLDGRVTTNEGDITTLKTDVTTGMDKLSNEMAKQDGRISSQGAMSMAEAQMASGAAAAAVGNPNGAWSVGLGSEQGHGAISAGYAKPVGRKSQISFGAAFGGDDHSIGVGFAHKL